MLVLIAGSYAYQTLERQRGASEFEIAKKAILAFDDGLRNIVWKPQSSRSTRFVANYGVVELVPSALNLTVTAQAGAWPPYPINLTTGIVRYYIKTDYITLGEGYKEYILGNETTIVPGSTEKLSQAVVEQQSKWLNTTLSYRVSAMKTSEVQSGSQYITYVDIQIVKLIIAQRSTYVGEFDLRAKSTSPWTNTANFTVTQGMIGTVSAKFGDSPVYSWTTPPLQAGTVVFNFVVAYIEVSV